MYTKEIPTITEFEYEFFRRLPNQFKYITLSLDREEIKLWTEEPHYVLCDWFNIEAKTVDISFLNKSCFWDFEDEEVYSIEELVKNLKKKKKSNEE